MLTYREIKEMIEEIKGDPDWKRRVEEWEKMPEIIESLKDEILSLEAEMSKMRNAMFLALEQVQSKSPHTEKTLRLALGIE